MALEDTAQLKKLPAAPGLEVWCSVQLQHYKVQDGIDLILGHHLCASEKQHNLHSTCSILKFYSCFFLNQSFIQFKKSNSHVSKMSLLTVLSWSSEVTTFSYQQVISSVFISIALNNMGIQILPCFPCGSGGKESACNAGDPGSITGLGRSAGEGIGYPLQYSGLENSMDSSWHHKVTGT